MIYLELEDFTQRDGIFDSIRTLLYDDRTVPPQYEKEKDGINKLEFIIDAVQNDIYYPDFFSKISFLFLALSTGHNFQNGNKRVAAFSAIYFFVLNGYRNRRVSKVAVKKWFLKNFPGYKLSTDFTFPTNFQYALYDLNKAINIRKEEIESGHTHNFDALKDIVFGFFTEFLYLV